MCRNRLGYDRGLEAMADDAIFDDACALVDSYGLPLFSRPDRLLLGDMIYVRSELYRKTRKKAEKAILFGEKEGRIALANRRKDPLYLFSALQRHLGYPSVPRPRPEDTQRYLLAALQRHVDRLEMRMELPEEELRGGINLSRFYDGGPEAGGRGTGP